MESFLMEKANLKIVGGPVDFAAGANTGGRVGLANADRVTFIVQMGAGTGGVVQASLKQSLAATGGTPKALAIANPVYYKAGTATQFTKDQPATATDAYDYSSTFATVGGILVFEVLAEDLDTNNGYGFVELDLADAGTSAKIGSVLAVVSQAKLGPAYSNDI